MMSKRKLAALGVFLACAGGITAHVRLFNPSNGNRLFWKGPGNISIVFDPTGSSSVADDSEETAMRLGLRAWNEDAGSKAQLVETTYNVTNACMDWMDYGVHLVFFDEANCSGFFPGGSGAVAVTPVVFNANGKILDADVIFNNAGFDFTTSAASGDFDIQDVGTHELGHLLGLDHSGWAGATMYPYVDPNLILQRSLSRDDINGLRHAYPEGSHGRIDGKVRRLSDSSGVAGAHVFAVDSDGRTAGAILTGSSGDFSLRGLDAGTYTLEVNPLDGTTTSANLQAGRTIETDFEATTGATLVVGAGQKVNAADVLVDSDVVVTLGTAFDDLPLEAETGATASYTLSGSGLAVGSTLTASDPDVTLSSISWNNTSVDFDITTLANADPGHFDLVVQTGGGDRSVLVAGVEIVPPVPTVTNVVPVKGNDVGGTALTISGTGFRPGARVIIGDAIYYDGEDGCSVDNSTTITLTSGPSSTGLFDVVVMDASGVENRDINAYTVASIPVLTSRFPTVGDAAGGTELLISGENFVTGMVVRINSVVQSTVVLEGTSTARVTTDAGVAGGPYTLEIENPSGETSTSAFSYVAQADPDLTTLSPASGAPSGGKTITLTGTGFTANTAVQFGVDPVTGAGGVAGTGVVFVNATTLQVTTPAVGAGRVAVMVQDTVTGQACILPDAFKFESGGGGGGGGGGCYMIPVDGPGQGPSPFLGAAWMLLLAAMVTGYARHARNRALSRL